MSLTGKRVAVLVEDGFEDHELTGPVWSLSTAGATVTQTGGGTCWAMGAVGGFRYEPFQPMRVGEPAVFTSKPS